MKKKQIGGLIVAAVLFIAVGVSSVLTNAVAQNLLQASMVEMLTTDYGYDTPGYDYIAVVNVVGTIQEQTATSIFEIAEGYQHTDTMDYIDNLMYDGNNKGILLYVDSPGGAVYESEELYEKLKEYKEASGNPVWTYMSHYAASGGYMISMATDRIFANANTTTGSIGVIMSGLDMTGLYEKLGIRYVSIASGDFKDSSMLTDEQIAVFQEQVDEYYGKFVRIVAEGRDMPEEEVRTLADGRTYTAQQALENGLIDQISSYEDMQTVMSDELGVWDFYEPISEENVFASFFSELKELVPKSEAQILKETASSMESGVPMYYAEQLR
ncbi:signal peptide peptidase SppA [Lachnospiraceae bacterium]|jgi:protease-4|nr:signal peptide peptidase SppA [uncultured Schaedlerella sp.]EOS39283.1 signal peptide peptidase SppA, 36K type [Lachnospiraceae bacterium M18-1]MCI9153393.1 signal peptide peptidase SppA [Ruminococcus sp.]NBI58183.1 signal peptide peptidase SppA [Lachnospiraceae bacterium]